MSSVQIASDCWESSKARLDQSQSSSVQNFAGGNIILVHVTFLKAYQDTALHSEEFRWSNKKCC